MITYSMTSHIMVLRTITRLSISMAQRRCFGHRAIATTLVDQACRGRVGRGTLSVDVAQRVAAKAWQSLRVLVARLRATSRRLGEVAVALAWAGCTNARRGALVLTRSALSSMRQGHRRRIGRASKTGLRPVRHRRRCSPCASMCRWRASRGCRRRTCATIEAPARAKARHRCACASP